MKCKIKKLFILILILLSLAFLGRLLTAEADYEVFTRSSKLAESANFMKLPEIPLNHTETGEVSGTHLTTSEPEKPSSEWIRGQFGGDTLLARLAECESGGNPNIPPTLDTNGKHSYGLLQFQLPTFLDYGKHYGILPSNMTEKEALEVIYDSHLQVDIAEKILEEKGGWRHWHNCATKLGINYD